MRACMRVEECERAREFARGSTNGGMIEKERERWREQPEREVWAWHSLRRTSLRRMESLTEGGEDIRRVFLECGHSMRVVSADTAANATAF